MSAAASDPTAWGACRYCGVANPAGARACTICGAADPVGAAEMATVPRAVRRRIQFTGGLRALIVVAVVIGLAYTITAAVWSGPPVAPDPLTTSGTYALAPTQSVLIWGEVTGGDYVVGNYTTVQPAGTSVTLSVYNSTEWGRLQNGSVATSAYSIGPNDSARIVFTAAYTDNFYFVFTNPYPPASGLNLTVYIATEYESNVGDDGFG
ncbi:MAG TPA: zinc ribbon domain-containing protein [Thermoplasmata archaeon]|nr:zinc ribbon domain-containing protein [Thermoplasmata archaeon]